MENGMLIYKFCVKDGLEEDKLQQLLTKITYRNSLYTLSTFKVIQRMLNEIIGQDEIKIVLPSLPNGIVLKDEDLIVIDVRGINIYTMNENKIENRYFWSNNEWENVVDDELWRRNMDEDVMNDNLVLPKLGIEMLKIAVEKNMIVPFDGLLN
ncbi:hypothetical protein GLOIN_2v1882411 [Rhizophagus clarus]|uniref:Uncharacterized protein n=2 Tax=Rhizophagus clarus TaxID=94130 RepID=A0A8H3R5E5_9GLOM|nr:hypothetical protein GLOIN_2v1882411 [Rhizophagus clarus]